MKIIFPVLMIAILAMAIAVPFVSIWITIGISVVVLSLLIGVDKVGYLFNQPTYFTIMGQLLLLLTQTVSVIAHHILYSGVLG